MTIGLRQVLTVLLLLLFSSEHLLATSVEIVYEINGEVFSISEEKCLLSIDLVAEENENRDDKFEGTATLPERLILAQASTALLAAEAYHKKIVIFLKSGTLPRYKFLCSYLI